MVALLDADRSIGANLDAASFAEARRELIAPTLGLARGDWNWKTAIADHCGHLGILVLDGLLTRRVTLGELEYSELLGAGDLLRPWVDDEDSSLASTASWQVLEPAQVALLDRDLAFRARRWPEVTAALLDRAVLRTRSLALTLAIHRAVRIEDRVILALWHLADRWGRVTPNGTVLSIPLTHDTLAQLVGARRSPVTIALGKLRRAGAIERGPRRAWILHGDPPPLVAGQRD